MESRDITKGRKRWVILVGLFFVSFLENGVIRSFALILNDLTREFDVSGAYIGSVLGLVFGAPHWLAFVNIPLLRRFSVRQLVMIGGALSTLGLVSSSWTQTGSQFSAAFSAYGFGITLTLLPTNTCPKDYFPGHIMIATGTLLSGGSVGVMFMPWLFEKLLVEYGWRGSVLILGGLNAHLLVIGALLEPVLKKGPSEVSTKDDSRVSVATGNDMHKGIVLNGEISEIARDEECSSLSNSLSISDKGSSIGTVKYEKEENTDLPAAWLDEADKDCSASVCINAGKAQMEVSVGSKYGSNNKCRAFGVITNFFGLTIFKEHPLMVSVCLQAFIFGLSYSGWLLYIVPNAIAKGLPPHRAVQISTIGGAFNFFGRLGIGFLWSRKCIKFEWWYSLMCLLAAAAFWTNFVADNFVSLSVLSACYGLLMGAFIPSQFQIVLKTVGAHRYRTAKAMYFIGRGLSTPVTGAIFGSLYDLTESYDISFGVISGLNVVIAFMNMAPACWNLFGRRKKRTPSIT